MSSKQPTQEARPLCQLCGEPMPDGEEMFNYHGYSGPCPKALLRKSTAYELPTCKKCSAEYHLPDGYEPTDYCNPCAQKLLPALLESHRELIDALDYVVDGTAPMSFRLERAAEALDKAKEITK